jgi:hypothetical protein
MRVLVMTNGIITMQLEGERIGRCLPWLVGFGKHRIIPNNTHNPQTCEGVADAPPEGSIEKKMSAKSVVKTTGIHCPASVDHGIISRCSHERRVKRYVGRSGASARRNTEEKP